jgi:PAS domain S-box-containing protein
MKPHAAMNVGGRNSILLIRAYVGSVGILGGIAILLSLYELTYLADSSRLLLLIALTAASSAAVLRMPTIPVSFSVAEIFSFSAVLLYGPAAGTVCVAVDCLVISFRLALRGLPARRLVLNATAPALAMWVAAHLLYLGFDVPRLEGEPLRFAEFVLPLSLCAFACYLLNTGSIAMAVAIEQRLPVLRVWREHFVQLWVSFLVGAHAAGLIVVSLGDLGLTFLAIVTPLPLVVFFAMRVWVARAGDQVRHLQEVNEASRKLQEQQRRQLETEVALRERDREFRAVFDHALDALVLVDDDRHLLDANPAACALLDISREALSGQAIDRFLSAGSAGEIAARWESLLAQGEHKGELVLSAARGDRTVEFSFTAGVVPGCHLFICRDVSERRKLEGQLQQLQKMETVGRLAGGVAHDFNNLLTAILGYSSMVAEQVEGSVREDVDEITRAANRAAALTRQLLAFSRKQVLQTSVVNLNGVIGDVEKMLQRLLDETLVLETRVDPALWPVKVDPTQMEQVILNLVVNARDAMPNGGTIVIETANVRVEPDEATAEIGPGSYVVLRVIDTGTGMDDFVRRHLFEPFFTTKDVGKGTGLGLPTVYGIVCQSGGHIAIDTAPGRGSTFSIYFPRVATTTAHGHADEGRSPAAVRGSETVLLADDDPAVRGLAKQILERHGYTVLEAENGIAACRVAEQYDKEIQVLVTDVAMPGMNGKELATVLQARIPGLKLVFISGYAGDAAISQAPNGHWLFLQKPFTPVALAGAVRDVLDAKAQLAEA